METPSRFGDFFLFLFLKGVTRFLKHTLEKSLFQTQVKQKGFTTTESLGLHCPPVATVVSSHGPLPTPAALTTDKTGIFTLFASGGHRWRPAVKRRPQLPRVHFCRWPNSQSLQQGQKMSCDQAFLMVHKTPRISRKTQAFEATRYDRDAGGVLIHPPLSPSLSPLRADRSYGTKPESLSRTSPSSPLTRRRRSRARSQPQRFCRGGSGPAGAVARSQSHVLNPTWCFPWCTWAAVRDPEQGRCERERGAWNSWGRP